MCGVRVCVGWDDGWLLSFGTGIAPDATCSITCAIVVCVSSCSRESALQSESSERLTRVTTSGDVGVVCVRLWDVATGANTKTLEGHSGGVWSVAFSAVLRCRLVAVMCVGCWLWVVGVVAFLCVTVVDVVCRTARRSPRAVMTSLSGVFWLSGCCVGRADRESAAKGGVEEGGRHEVQIGELCLGSMGDTGDGAQQSVA